ncbi:MAG: cell division topological specificity factor MinE [Mesorhizobium amorphae]|nr:MAG: cell division topological specificity factor MinE [Mesorhizobium amorphae]
MTLHDFLSLFRRRRSAPVARERLQLLLAYERAANAGSPDLVAVLREEIMAVIGKYVRVDQRHVHVAMDRGERMSTLEIDIHIPNVRMAAAA